MIPAWDALARAGVEPQVGGSSVRDNSEFLGWSSDGNSGEILSVHVISDGNIFSESSSEVLGFELFFLVEDVFHGKRLSGKRNLSSNGKIGRAHV